jgi:protocatechuate 3,4-dioxygenase, alpha subunit
VAQVAPSPSQTSGPLWGFALLFEGSEHAVDPEAPGAIELRGRVIQGDGQPLGWPDALIEIWQGEQLARTRTDADGRFQATVAKPSAGVLPDGRALAPCLNLALFSRGLLKQLVTRVYFPDEEDANAVDPVLERVPHERRDALVARPEGDALRFDIVLQGDGETPFFQL